MPQGFEIIRARVKDDAVVLIDRLMRSQQAEVVLVLPKNSIIAADLNSLKILKEEAESVSKMLSLNTDNDKIKSFAKTLGMKIYNPDDYKKTENMEPKRSVKKIKIMSDILPPSPVNKLKREIIVEDAGDSNEESSYEDYEEKKPELEIQEPVVVYETASKNYELEKNLENFYGNKNGYEDNQLEPKSINHFFSLNKIIIFFTASGLILFGIAMYLVLPKVNIKISLKEIPLKIQIPVAISKSVTDSNLGSGIIPGQYISLSKSGSKTIDLSSSGTATKIGGTIEIYNAYSSAPQKVIAQTRFETKDGKVFRIQSPVTIPGAKMSGTQLIPSSIKVNVIGDNNSDDYLIGPSYFVIPGFKGSPKYAGFYGQSTESMTKIAAASSGKIGLDEFKKNFSNELAEELKTNTLNTLKDSDLRLIDGASSVTINDSKIDGNILSMKITWQAILFKEKDLRDLIDYSVLNHFTDLKNFTFEDNITYPAASRVDFKKGELFFTFNLDKTNALPADVDSLKKELAGQDENNMRSIISNKSYVGTASISLWPFWVKKAPDNPNKINVTIDNQ